MTTMPSSPDRGSVAPRTRVLLVALLVLAGPALSTAVLAQGTGGGHARFVPAGEIFTFLFLMLGPIKIIGPYAKLTQAADTRAARLLAFRAIFYATIGVLLAAAIGQGMLDKYGVPVPVLAVAGGVILFLVALQTVLHQFDALPGSPAAAAVPPPPSAAITPLAFPTIVTPYGIAAVIVFTALRPDLEGKLTIAGLVLGIMALNLIAMLTARHILRILGVALQILGSVLGIVQIALGLEIILASMKSVW